MDTHMRSIAKTVSFRTIATITTMVLVLVFTRNMILAGMIGVFDLVSKLVIYYFHERVWERISWGRKTEQSERFISSQPTHQHPQPKTPQDKQVELSEKTPHQALPSNILKQ